MHVLIVFAHPSRESFAGKVLDRFCAGLKDGGHTFEISDLYAQDFQAIMSREEYLRETAGRAELPVAADVAAEQHKINQASGLCFIYPVWWSDTPAVMKGWFDRVLTAGFAYEKNGVPAAMKHQEKGMVICTAGHGAAYFEENGLGHSMKNVMLGDRMGDRVREQHMHILDGSLGRGEVLHPQLAEVYQLGKRW
ncbi:MAG: NAD(P)H-dependent oxidoreductase [Bacteroidota bacterium]